MSHAMLTTSPKIRHEDPATASVESATEEARWRLPSPMSTAIKRNSVATRFPATDLPVRSWGCSIWSADQPQAGKLSGWSSPTS